MSPKIRYLCCGDESSDLLKLCRYPDRALQSARVLIKDDNTTTLGRLNTDIGELVIKRYNTKNLWHLLRRNFQTSRASNCLKMSEIFEKAGIRVTRPVAVIESSYGPFKGRSWFVSRFLDNEMLLDFLNRDQGEAVLDKIRDQIVDIFVRLKQNKLSHGDMKATNILVSDDGLTMIDLDASCQHRNNQSHQNALNRDRLRFLKNWADNIRLQQFFSDALDRAVFDNKKENTG